MRPFMEGWVGNPAAPHILGQEARESVEGARTKVGRRNHYTVNPQAPLRHPLEEDHTIGEILVTLGRLKPKRTPRPRR